MKALAVIDKNLALGYKNDLLFRLPSDLAHFKKHTLGQTVVMGQKTLESMPNGKALPGRNTLVLNIDAPTAKLYDVALSKEQVVSSGAETESCDGISKKFVCFSFNSLDEYHAYVSEHKEELGELVLSGGATLYKLLLSDCDTLILTEVDAKAENADVYFPEFRDEFKLVSEEGPFSDGELKYYIRTYSRR